MGRSSSSWMYMTLFFIGLAVHPVLITGQDVPEELAGPDPCQNANAIGLHSNGKCLVPVKKASNWITAQATCERAGGSLYRMESLIINSTNMLMRCLAAIDDNTFSDLWFDAVGVWFQHFHWTNKTLLNPPTYCTSKKPHRENAPLGSTSLSVDFCVSTCHNDADRFVVIHHTNMHPECYCLNNYQSDSKDACSVPVVDYANTNTYYIIHSRENSLIEISRPNAFTSSEILCATVDKDTFTDREMKSDTCFTRRPFICNLGTAAECPSEGCAGPECLFTSRGRCMKRVNYEYTWYEGRNYCNNLGGDLWTMQDFQEMVQIGQYLNRDTRYWIGATNFIWQFSTTSSIVQQYKKDKLRCGHVFHQQNTQWQWSDSECDQPKSFLCEFPMNSTTSGGTTIDDVTCPWPVPDLTPSPLPPTQPTPGPITSDDDDDAFPIAALIAGIIAGLILLTCLAVALTFCWRRQWAAEKFHKAKERLAFIPYFADNSNHTALGTSADFESMSNAGHMRGNMSSVSEHGSQIGLIKGGFQSTGFSNHAFSSSYNDQSDMFSGKQKEAMERKLADSQNFLVSNNNSMDERGFASMYNTMGGKSKEEMTLEAEMNIQDDAEVAALRGSLRGKPEVTLVTDNVDMNFTVNHAMSHVSHPGSERSRSSLERTMEEITLPVSGGNCMTVTLPERVTEAHIIRSTSQHEL